MNCRVLLDANALLALYTYNTPDLTLIEEFLIGNKNNIMFILSDIIIDEYKRNRAKKIQEAINRFEKDNQNFGVPNVIRELEIYNDYAEAKNTMHQLAKQAINQAKEKANSRQLFADKIANHIFENAKILEVKDDSEVLAAAEKRKLIGNPPGKRDEVGDRITWEALLKYCKDGDLYILTEDTDYFSPLAQKIPNCKSAEAENFLISNMDEFLQEEWNKHKNGKVYIVRGWECLVEYFITKEPCTQFTTSADEALIQAIKEKIRHAFERYRAVEKLINSESFKETHAAIERLRKYSDFTKTELRGLLKAYITNTQIFWIIQDYDVKEFAQKLLHISENYADDSEIRTLSEKLKKLIDRSKSESDFIPDEDLPF